MVEQNSAIYNRQQGKQIMNVMEKLYKNGISLNCDDIVNICKKYYITELSIFGSSIRDDLMIIAI
ncbi:MAG: hypothetical protein LBI90_09365 [Treponema sp.]|nr:hypothetical protein [Treponema sp.]